MHFQLSGLRKPADVTSAIRPERAASIARLEHGPGYLRLLPRP